MSKIGVAVWVLMLVAKGFSAPVYLTGEQEGDYPIGEYMVTGKVYVLPEKTLSFAAGSKVLFENYTGIVVRGKLVTTGTGDNPVIFTSSKDIPVKTKKKQTKKSEGAAAFDWNGIDVENGSQGIELSNTSIKYSTFGISVKSDSIAVKLDSVTFSNNGTRNLSKNDKLVDVEDSVCISLNWSVKKIELAVVDSAPKSTSPKPVLVVKNKKPGDWKFPVRIGGGVLAVGGLVYGIMESVQSADYYAKYNDQTISSTLEMVNQNKQKSIDASAMQWIGYGFAFLGLSGVAITFVF